jgi:hypothetical protein
VGFKTQGRKKSSLLRSFQRLQPDENTQKDLAKSSGNLEGAVPRSGELPEGTRRVVRPAIGWLGSAEEDLKKWSS